MNEWLNLLFPLANIMLAGLVSFYVAKYQLSKPLRSSVLENQYQNVLAPLHRIMFFSELSKEAKLQAIEQVLSEHYSVVHPAILDCWKKTPEHFSDAIEYAYKIAAYKLGYSQIKVKMPKNLPPEMAKMIQRADKIYGLIIGIVALAFAFGIMIYGLIYSISAFFIEIFS